MLVIRRRAGERLLIGEGIEIEVLEVRASGVKLGIKAPERVPVLRAEVRLTRDANVSASLSLESLAIESLLGRLAERIP
jgi:carbon storage regulator